MKKNKTIFIIAGESSGDLHGAGIMKEMNSGSLIRNMQKKLT